MKKILLIAAASMFGSALYAQTQPAEPVPAPASDTAAMPTDPAATTPPADPTAVDAAQPATTEATPPSDNGSATQDDSHKGKHKKKPRGGM
jgi:hypothetical protein